ncbi:MAG: hypothetical protein PHH24_03180 [Candidatus Moranbacteria bacterium]|jgi:uncharacterized protein YoxC|nr:hypothetical protein [Candidatus Moranbacteria bacterium]MDX9855244.1 hypothetical protein [Candidatus Moranbacteria bacterium]
MTIRFEVGITIIIIFSLIVGVYTIIGQQKLSKDLKAIENSIENMERSVAK